MQIQENISLKPYNTFSMDVPAEYFIALHNEDELREISDTHAQTNDIYILGGGSNVLLTKPVKGTVVYNQLKGISIEKENDEHVWLKVQAGEVWHELVLYVINKGWAGIENLALIPGSVGAAPMQNIGAYGVEAKETIDTVTGWHWKEKTFLSFKNEKCHFGYRDSIFKREWKNKLLISSVTFKLNKKPSYHVSYGAIKHELEKMNVQELSIKAIADAVIAIRSSKLPNPKEIGNAGSFFKNPTIPIAQYDILKINYPEIPSYPVNEEMVKVPAGWLIEQCGWKGYRKDDAGVHAKQALVLVNYGQAKGDEIWALSEEVVRSVEEKYGILLEREVQVW
jgi:UDP-N-acetylmuramate dehydrogenase